MHPEGKRFDPVQVHMKEYKNYIGKLIRCDDYPEPAFYAMVTKVSANRYEYIIDYWRLGGASDEVVQEGRCHVPLKMSLECNPWFDFL